MLGYQLIVISSTYACVAPVFEVTLLMELSAASQESKCEQKDAAVKLDAAMKM